MRNLLLVSLALFSLIACDPNSNAVYDDVQDKSPHPLTLADVQADAAASVIKPCGLWIAGSDLAVDARHTASPTKPDIYQTLQPGGLSCSALIEAIPSFEASWVGGHAVVYYINAP